MALELSLFLISPVIFIQIKHLEKHTYWLFCFHHLSQYLKLKTLNTCYLSCIMSCVRASFTFFHVIVKQSNAIVLHIPAPLTPILEMKDIENQRTNDLPKIHIYYTGEI